MLALDSFPVVPTAAWGLRRLLTSYVGSIARTDRDSGGLANDIGFLADDSLHRYTVENSHAFYGGVTNWTIWYDQSGHGRHTNGGAGGLVKQGYGHSGAYVGGRLGAINVGVMLTCNLGAAAHSTIFTKPAGTILFAVQCWFPGGIFGDNGGWFGVDVVNLGAADNLDFHLNAWHWNTTQKFTPNVPVKRYRAIIGAARWGGGEFNAYANGEWGTPVTASVGLGGSETIFQLGVSSRGQIMECICFDTARSDEEIAAWAEEASEYYGILWSPSDPGGGGGGSGPSPSLQGNFIT